MDHHVARPRRAFVGIAAMAVGAVALIVGAFPGAAGATDGPDGGHGGGGGGSYPPPVESPCPDDGWYWHWGPHNQNEVPGEHTEDDANIESGAGGDITFTISNIRDEGEGKAFDFTSSVPVVLVFVKGYQDAGHTNEFETPATSGTVTGGDDYVKHVIVCPAEDVPPSTTSSTQPSTTTSEATTTTMETTTTEAPPTSEAPTTSTPPSTEAPTTTVSSGGGLPVTGGNTGPLVAIGGGLLAAGVVLVLSTRRYWQRFI